MVSLFCCSCQKALVFRWTKGGSYLSAWNRNLLRTYKIWHLLQPPTSVKYECFRWFFPRVVSGLMWTPPIYVTSTVNWRLLTIIHWIWHRWGCHIMFVWSNSWGKSSQLVVESRYRNWPDRFHAPPFCTCHILCCPFNDQTDDNPLRTGFLPAQLYGQQVELARSGFNAPLARRRGSVLSYTKIHVLQFRAELILLQYFSASMILILWMPVRRGSVNVAMLSVDMLQDSAQMPA